MGATAEAVKPVHNGTGTPAAAAEEPKKSRRGGARKAAPDGHTPVKFALKDEEHAQLARIAAEDDRAPEDYARVIVRKHLRQQSAQQSG